MDYKNLNDYELLYYVSDSEENTNIIVQKYEPIIKKMALDFYQTNKNIGLEYDDFYQEAYIGFLSGLNFFDERKNVLFYTFVVVCIKRQLQNLIREHSSLRKKVLNDSVSFNNNYNDDLTFIELFGSDKMEPSLMAEERELMSIFEKFLYQFKAPQICIWQLFINGYCQREIAKLLEISEQTVSNTVCQIRKKMRTKYEYYLK